MTTRVLARLSAQVSLAILLGVAVGLVWPQVGALLQPLDAAFVSLIRAVVIPLIFCAAASGAAKIAQEARVLGRLAVQPGR